MHIDISYGNYNLLVRKTYEICIRIFYQSCEERFTLYIALYITTTYIILYRRYIHIIIYIAISI